VISELAARLIRTPKAVVCGKQSYVLSRSHRQQECEETDSLENPGIHRLRRRYLRSSHSPSCVLYIACRKFVFIDATKIACEEFSHAKYICAWGGYSGFYLQAHARPAPRGSTGFSVIQSLGKAPQHFLVPWLSRRWRRDVRFRWP
jgi:hypothetical protein